jgi:signal transduction histidine kinase
MRRSIKQLKHVFDEFRKGNYEYDLENLEETTEKEYAPLIESIKKMIGNIIQFDRLKEIKISAHYGKIKALLASMSDGAMIIDNSGEILYTNEVMMSKFKNLDLDQNKDFLDTIYPDSFEKTIKKYVKEVLVKAEKKDPCRMFIPEMNLEFTIKSALYKNRSGDFLGAVFIITDLLEKIEVEKENEEIKENNTEDKVE